MVPFLGQGWGSGLVHGHAAKFSWTDAVARFGRGRDIPASHCAFWGDEHNPAQPLTPVSYQSYKQGSKSYSFAGHSDWRLPTVEELWSLDGPSVLGTLLDSSEQVWSANSSTETIRARLSLLDTCAWIFEGEQMPRAFGDLNIDVPHAVRLVRAGNMYEVLR